MGDDGKVAVIGGDGRRLQEALRRARVTEAERSDVIVDLKAAEMNRLETLREAVEPLFREIPDELLQFDLGLQRASEPRLWVDMIAFVVMGRDKETYRFLQDTLNGRRVLMESKDIEEIADRITDYVALRMVEREKAVAAASDEGTPYTGRHETATVRRRKPEARHEEADSEALAVLASQPAPMPQRSGGLGWFVGGLLVGIVGLFAIGWILTMPG